MMERWISIGLFIVSFVAAVGAMAFTFLDNDTVSLSCGAVAVIMAIGGLCFALKNLNTKKESEEDPSEDQP